MTKEALKLNLIVAQRLAVLYKEKLDALRKVMQVTYVEGYVSPTLTIDGNEIPISMNAYVLLKGVIDDE
jgi:hypothetical protein